VGIPDRRSFSAWRRPDVPALGGSDPHGRLVLTVLGGLGVDATTIGRLTDRLDKIMTNQRRAGNGPGNDEQKALVVQLYGQEAEAVRGLIEKIERIETLRQARRIVQRAIKGGLPGESRAVRATT
jgi:hypothetical protein